MSLSQLVKQGIKMNDFSLMSRQLLADALLAEKHLHL